MRKHKGLFLVIAIVILSVSLVVSPGHFYGNDFRVSAAARRPTSSGQFPQYSGAPSIEVHNNKPYFKKIKLKQDDSERYGQLDAKGRCTAATAMLSKDLI